MAAALHAATIAHVDPRGRVIYQAEGAAPRVAAADGSAVRLSADGKRLVSTRWERDMPRRTLVLWDAATGASRDLITGFVADPHFSADGSRIAFLRIVTGDRSGWNLWIMPVAEPAKAARVSTRDLTSLCGWTAADRAIAAVDEKSLHWIAPDGKVLRTVSLDLLYARDFEWTGNNVLRLETGHPDMVLLSAYRAVNPPGALLDAGEPQLNSTIALVDMKSGRSTTLLSPKAWGHDAVWSPDGVWIYFTRLEARRKYAVWRMRADGSGLERVAEGSQPAVAR
jgi:dipeptidyl aminopeptidase/acylaminoacyl peptidase